MIEALVRFPERLIALSLTVTGAAWLMSKWIDYDMARRFDHPMGQR